MDTPATDALVDRIKRLAGELNAALTEAAVTGLVVNVSVKAATAKGVGPSIEVELLKRL